MIRVALFISGGEKGGSRYQVLKILEGLKERVSFTFFTFYDGMLKKDILNKGYKNYHFSKLFAFNEIKKILKKEKFDLIHTYGFRGNLYGRVSSKNLDIPVISTYTGFMKDDYNNKIKGAIFEKIDNITLNIPKVVIVSSKVMSDYILKRGYKRDVRIIHLGIDINFEFYDRSDFGLNEDDFVIGSVLRFEKVKNPLFLIDVFNEVIKKEKKAKLVLVGDGSLRNEIERKIKEYKIVDKVLLLGFRDDVKKIYKIFDLFILTSIKEGFSLSTLEAMSSSLPVVVSDSGGVREMVEDGVNGFIIKNFNKFEFADKILFFKDKNKKEEIGKLNRNKVLENFEVKKMCDETYDLYCEVVK